VTANLATGKASGDGTDSTTGIDNLTGGAGSDHLTGYGDANILVGGAGNDDLVAKASDDTLFGGPGNDTREGDAGVDAIYGGPGNNTCIDKLAECDNTAPQLVGLTFSATSVDTSTQSQTVYVHPHITDDLAGFAGNTTIDFYGPTGQNAQCTISTGALISGTLLDGTYECGITILHLAEKGTWTLAQGITLQDGSPTPATTPCPTFKPLGSRRR
jgi:hypothetical protein